MDPALVLGYTAVVAGCIGQIAAVVGRVIIARRALDNVPPHQRPAVLRALATVFRASSPGPLPSLARRRRGAEP
jgi:hypothetical protein